MPNASAEKPQMLMPFSPAKLQIMQESCLATLPLASNPITLNSQQPPRAYLRPRREIPIVVQDLMRLRGLRMPIHAINLMDRPPFLLIHLAHPTRVKLLLHDRLRAHNLR